MSDKKYEGTYVLPPVIPMNESGWSLYPKDPNDKTGTTFKGVTKGSGPKVVYSNGDCFIRNDFVVKNDWWQLYPSSMEPFTLKRYL